KADGMSHWHGLFAHGGVLLKVFSAQGAKIPTQGRILWLFSSITRWNLKWGKGWMCGEIFLRFLLHIFSTRINAGILSDDGQSKEGISSALFDELTRHIEIGCVPGHWI